MTKHFRRELKKIKKQILTLGSMVEELVQMAQKYSPVFNTITKSAPVSVHLDK